MEIRQVEKVEEIWDALQRYDGSATRKLTDRVASLELYAEKLFQHAENYKMFQNDSEIGFFSFYANDMIGKRAYLALIAIDVQHQRKGNGGRALQFIMNECHTKQMNSLRLEVDKMNENSLCFYKRNGFLIVEEASDVSVIMEREV